MPTTQGVILAAGKSSRFSPFSEMHKSSFHICGRPIIFWTLDSLAAAGITEALIIINPEETTFKQELHSYKHDTLQIKIGFQPVAQGMADALLSVREQLADNFIVVNAAQVKAEAATRQLIENPSPLVLLAQPTDQPTLFGIVTVENGLATHIWEKPQQRVNEPLRVVGMYKLSKQFIEFLSEQQPSEYMLEEGLDTFVGQNQVPVLIYAEQLSSLKYAWHLLDIKNDILSQAQPFISATATIHPTALIDDDVIIEYGAVVGAFAIVSEGSYVGKNAVVGQHCIVRKQSVIEAHAEVQRQAEISNTLFMAGATIHSGFIGDSVVGKEVKIGAGFITANKRFDRQPVEVMITDAKVSSGKQALGVLIGSGTTIGIQVGTMPGTLIMSATVVQPGIIIKGKVE